MRVSTIILALCISVCCCAKEYFVSNSGNDRWAGTKAKPFKTIKKAVSVVKPGDIVTVRGGIYREKVEIRCSGTAEKPIVFRGAPGETALSTGAFPVTQAWKKTPGYRYIYQSRFPYAITMLFDSSLITRYMPVDDMNYLDRQPGAFLLDRKTGDLYINTFSGRDPNMLNIMAVPLYGGRLQAGHGGGRTGNTLQPYSADPNEYYIWNKGFIVYGKHIIIENFTLGFWPGQAIRINAPAEHVIVRNNTVYGGTCGIMFYGDVKHSQILNNRVFRVAGTGIQLGGSGEKCLVKGNYVFNCGTCSPFKSAPEASSGNIFNIAHYGSFRNTDIIDNIVVSTDRERTSRVLMRNKGAIRRHTTQTGNVFYGGGVSLYAAENSTANLSNNTCFQGKIGIGKLKTENKYEPVMKGNLFIEDKKDPKFADVYHRDFRLQSDSPHLGKGAFPKVGNVFYAKNNGSGDGSAASKAATLAGALKKAAGKDAVIYLLPGTYNGSIVLGGKIKLANYEGGKVIFDKLSVKGGEKVTVDGIIFKNSSIQINGELLARRSVFDGVKVSSKKNIFENDTFRSTAVAGVTILRNAFICGEKNTFAFAGMISENNFFNSEKAFKAFRSKVNEAHKSAFVNVKLNPDYTLPANSRLTCAGLDCSAIGGQPVKEYSQPMQIENLQVKQISADSALISWDTPRHYCNVNVRVKCIETKKGFFGGSSNQETGLRSTHGEVVLRKLLPGKNYEISCHFYSVRKEPMVTKKLNFKVSTNFKHKAVTLQVDPKASGAFRTISDALAKAGPGDTIIVAPGVYMEQFNIYASGITLKSRVPGKAFINIASLFTYAIKVVSANNVTIDGFQFIGLPYSASNRALHIVGTRNFTLRNCFFHRPDKGKGVSNIQFFGTNVNGVLVENCVFDSGFHGLWLYPANNVTIRNNTFYGNGVNAIHVGCEQGWKTEIYNNIFQDVVSNHINSAVTVAEYGPHIYCDYNLYHKTSRAPLQRYFAFGRHSPTSTYSAPWTIKRKNQPATLKETQQRFGIEKNAIEKDPLFVNVGKADFSFKPGSPAIGKGKDGKNIGADFSIFKK